MPKSKKNSKSGGKNSNSFKAQKLAKTTDDNQTKSEPEYVIIETSSKTMDEPVLDPVLVPVPVHIPDQPDHPNQPDQVSESMNVSMSDESHSDCIVHAPVPETVSESLPPSDSNVAATESDSNVVTTESEQNKNMEQDQNQDQEQFQDPELLEQEKELEGIMEEIMKETEDQGTDTKDTNKNLNPAKPAEPSEPSEPCKVCKPFVLDHEIVLVVKRPFANPDWKPSDMCKKQPTSMWEIVTNFGDKIIVNSDHYSWTEYNEETKKRSYQVFIPYHFVCRECDDIFSGVKYTFSASKVDEKTEDKSQENPQK